MGATAEFGLKSKSGFRRQRHPGPCTDTACVKRGEDNSAWRSCQLEANGDGGSTLTSLAALRTLQGNASANQAAPREWRDCREGNGPMEQE